MKAFFRLCLTLILLGAAAGAGPGAQSVQAAANATYTVNSFADLPDENPANGVCEATGGFQNCTLRAAVMEANNHPDSLIYVPAGTFLLDRPFTTYNDPAAGSLKVLSNMQIQGAGIGLTIIDGNNGYIQDRVLTVFGVASFRLGGVTLQHGKPTQDFSKNDPGGGGLLLDGTQSAVLQDIEIAHNAIIWGSMLSGHGAGVKADDAISMVFERVWIHDNASLASASNADGGGVYFNNGDIQIKDSRISSNFAGRFGGGIYALAPDSLSIYRSTISTNISGYDGGGLYVDHGTVYLTDSTISGNQTAGSGGGIYSSILQVMNLYSSTITGNSSNTGHNGGQGGGIYHNTSLSPDARLYNNLIAGNSEITQNPTGAWQSTPGDLRGNFYSGGYNAINAPMDSVFSGTMHIYDLMNQFTTTTLGPLADNGGLTPTHALLIGSQAINAGNPAGCLDANGLLLATDQRGKPRTLSGRCEIGAYERNAQVFLPLTRK
jgi:CSLREA domain-containing protein